MLVKTENLAIKTDLTNLTKKMRTLELSQTEFALVLSMVLLTTDRPKVNNDENILASDNGSVMEEYENLAHLLQTTIESNPMRRQHNNTFIFAKVIEGLTLSRAIGLYLRKVLQSRFQNRELENKFKLLAEVVKDHCWQ